MSDKVSTLKRKVKEINGVKVNHPHSAANIFYAIFTLLLVAVPVGMLFVPLIIIDGVLEVNGLEFAKALFTGFKSAADTATPLGQFVDYTNTVGGNMAMVSKYLIYVQSAFWGLFLALGIFAFVLTIIILSKGFLKKAKGPKAIAGMMFGFGILYGLSFLIYYILEMMQGGKSNIKVWYSFAAAGAALILLIIIGIMYSANFRECIQEADLEYHEDTEGNVVTHVTQVHNVTKYKYEQANTLPNNLTSIGGHAYSQNQALTIANIPLGVPSLGNGAFSNCLKLKVVTIPKSVKEIGMNCFFNCASLERVNYAGTKDEWRKVKRGSNWLAKAKTTKVVCTDGVLVVNPYC